jgi:hypothetical protein
MTQIHCYPTFKQKVIVPSRVQLLKKLKPLEHSLVNLVMLRDEMIDRLAFYLHENLRVDVYSSLSYKCPPDTIIPSAEYFATSDSNRAVPIHVTLISHPNTKTFCWDQQDCAHMFGLLADTIIHEMVHMRNTRKREFQQFTNYEYDDELIILSDPDCIDAYAHNIADDIANAPSPWEIVRNPSNVTVEDSVSLWNYMTVFGKSVEHPAMRRLMKKVYALLMARKINVDNPNKISVF